MPKKPSKPHDEFFKATFGRLDIALEYLQQMLPEDIRQDLDLSALERINGSFVSPQLKEYFSDVVYQCTLKDRVRKMLLTFIFEHKSNVEQYPHLQLLRYILDTWDEQLKQNKTLTLVIPIVVYHGKRKWEKRDLATYFGKNLPESLLPYCPKFDYLLTSVQDLKDEQILELRKGLLINTFLMMKHIWEPEFILQHPDLIFIHLEQNRLYEDFQGIAFAYFFKNTEIAKGKIQQFIQELPPSLNKNAMSTYEMILEEGIEKGRKEGREEGREETLFLATREMLLKDLDYNLIAQVLHVELEFIEKVKEALLKKQEGFLGQEDDAPDLK